MSIDRKVSLWQTVSYRGGNTMLVWLLHRITGIAMVFFISLHILAGFLTQQLGSEVGIWLNTIYESTSFQTIIIFCVLFHVFNGLRIVVLDVYPALIEYQKEVIWLQWLVFIPIYGLTLVIMFLRVLGGQ